MRQKNWRLVAVGVVMAVAAVAFFSYMQSMAPRSTDPVALMQTVGQVAGVVGGLGLAMVLWGLLGRRQA